MTHRPTLKITLSRARSFGQALTAEAETAHTLVLMYTYQSRAPDMRRFSISLNPYSERVGGRVRLLEIATLGLGGGKGRVRPLASVTVEPGEMGRWNSGTGIETLTAGGRPFAEQCMSTMRLLSPTLDPVLALAQARSTPPRPQGH